MSCILYSKQYTNCGVNMIFLIISKFYRLLEEVCVGGRKRQGELFSQKVGDIAESGLYHPLLLR